MTRRLSITVPLLALAVALGCSEATPARPDVFFIVVDSLRADHLDHLGYERPTAAGLDRFRDESTLFTNATSPAPWSVPATASLLTGLFPLHHGADRRGAPIAKGVPTLAARLRERGFLTAALSHNPEISERHGLASGFERFTGPPESQVDFPDASEMLPWLRELLAAGGDRPLFAYLQPMNLHGPYRVPSAHLTDLLGYVPGNEFFWGHRLMRSIQRQPTDALRAQVTKARLDVLVDRYDTAVRYTLDRVGEVIELLRRADRYDDALVVVTADHGEELFDHGGFGHGYSLHREVLHVPLYVKLPGGSELRSIETPVSLLDLVPTVLEVLELPAIESDGRSLVPLLRGEKGDPERIFYHQTAWRSRAVAGAVTQGRYKFVRTTSDYERRLGGQALYDRLLDPTEEANVAEQGAEIAARLSSLLADEFRRMRAAAPRAQSPASP